jgi:hypothetical protein
MIIWNGIDEHPLECVNSSYFFNYVTVSQVVNYKQGIKKTETKSEKSAREPKLCVLLATNLKADIAQTMNAFIPELTLLRVLNGVVKIVPWCQSVSADLKYRQTQRCVVFRLDIPSEF